MTELLLLSMTLSSPPAEIPVSVRANMAVHQATARMQQNTPVRAPTSSLLVPSQYLTPTTRTLTQPTGVYYSRPFASPPVTVGQTTGGIPVMTAPIQNVTGTSVTVGTTPMVPIRIPVLNVVRTGVIADNCQT